MIVDGYGEAGPPRLKSISAVERNWLAVSFSFRTAVFGVPTFGPVSVRFIVSMASVSRSGHIGTPTTFAVSPGLKMTVWVVVT